jgi:hypothetical protein
MCALKGFTMDKNLIIKIHGHISPVDSVVDLGAMFGENLVGLNCSKKLGVEIYPPYLDKYMADGDVVCADALEWISAAGDDSWDVVLAIDLVEHMTIPDGLLLLKNAARVARRRVLAFTPNGYYHQDAEQPCKRNSLIASCGINKYQEHLSAWSEKLFNDIGFDTEIVPMGMIPSVFAVWEKK